MSKRKRPIWFTKNLVAISWVSLLQDAASEMLYPIMPVFLNSVLGAPAAIIGAIEGAAEGAAALTKLASNWLNRFIPRKTMVVVGYAAAAIGKFLIAIAATWPIVLLGRVVDRLGKGTRSAARDAILVQGVGVQDRGKVIGFHRTSDTTGAVVGPLLALILLSLLNGDIRAILWFALVPAVLSTLATFFIRDTDPSTRKSVSKKVGIVNKAEIHLSSKIKSLIWVLAIFSLVNFPDALVLLHLSQDGFAISEVVGLYLLFNISYASLSFPAGLLSDRMKPQRVYAIGLICFAIAYGGLALTSAKPIAYVLVMIYGGFAAVNDVVGKSWVSKLAESHQQLSVQARLQGLTGFGLLFAGIWAGLVWNFGSGMGSLPLLVSAIIGIFAAGYFGRLR